MPEKVTGQPDQFEELLKKYCQETYGEPRPVEAVWNKLALELNATPQTSQVETELTASDDDLLLEAAPTPLPVWRRRGPFSLVAGLALATVIALTVIGLVLATSQGRSNLNTAISGGTPPTTTGPVPTITPVSAGFPDLNYPQASQLKLDAKDPWPTGKLEMDGKQLFQKFALGTSSQYSQVVTYYQNLLANAGYNITALETMPLKCDPTSCDAPLISITSLAASKGSLHIGIMVLSPQSWLPLNLSTYMNLGRQVKDTDTLIMITQAADSSVAINNTGPTATAGPSVTVLPAPTTPPNVDVVSEPAVTEPAMPVTPPVEATTANLAGFPDLGYTRARELNLPGGWSWPDNLLNFSNKQIVKAAALATSDDFKLLVNYYKQRLTEAGFTITASDGLPTPCATANCPDPFPSIATFAASKGLLHIEVIVVSPNSWKARAQYIYTFLGQQLQPNESLVLYAFARDN